MEAIDNIRNGGQIERQSEGAGVGAFSYIRKQQYQPIDNALRIAPVFEAATVGAARGLFAIVAGAGALAMAAAVGVRMPESVVWPLLGLDCLAGVGVALYTLQAKVGAAFDAYRNRPLSTEIYKRGSAAAAQSETARVVVENIERPSSDTGSNGAGRIVYDALDVAPDVLALAVRADVVSKSALMRQGVSERQVPGLLSQLLSFGFATASTANKAGEWTAKGRALRRALVASGGGGGDGVFAGDTTTTTVGEGGGL